MKIDTGLILFSAGMNLNKIQWQLKTMLLLILKKDSLRLTKTREYGWASSRKCFSLTNDQHGVTRQGQSNFQEIPSFFQLTEDGLGRVLGKWLKILTIKIGKDGLMLMTLMVLLKDLEDC